MRPVLAHRLRERPPRGRKALVVALIVAGLAPVVPAVDTAHRAAIAVEDLINKPKRIFPWVLEYREVR